MMRRIVHRDIKYDVLLPLYNLTMFQWMDDGYVPYMGIKTSMAEEYEEEEEEEAEEEEQRKKMVRTGMKIDDTTYRALRILRYDAIYFFLCKN